MYGISTAYANRLGNLIEKRIFMHDGNICCTFEVSKEGIFSHAF